MPDLIITPSSGLIEFVKEGEQSSTVYRLEMAQGAGLILNAPLTSSVGMKAPNMMDSFGNNIFSGTSTFNGPTVINGNLSVFGTTNLFSASNVYISSSQLTIEDNILTLNAFSPFLRYAGIEMIDSGSGTLSSMLWDGQGDYFFLSGSNVNGKILTGPDNQVDLSSNYVPKATAGYKLGNSLIYDNGTNVGIGTSVPTAKIDTLGVRIGRDFSLTNRATVRLDSNGTSIPSDVLFGHTAAANQDGWNGVYWSLSSRGSGEGNKFHFYRGSGNPTGASELVIMTLDPAMNVGIGTTSPTQKLEVAGYVMAGEGAYRTNIYGSNGGAWIGFGNTSSLNSLGRIGAYGALFNINSLNGDTSFQYDSAEKMRITTGGHLGLGITNPDAYVNANGNWFRPSTDGLYSSIYATTEAVVNLISSGSSDGAAVGGVYFTRARAQGDAHYQIAAIKAFQAGTSNTIAGGTLYFYTKNNNGGTAATDPAMVIGPGGNVGIGTTGPNTKLHIYGSGGGFEFGVGSPNCYIETIDRASVGKDLNTGYYTRGSGSFTWSNGSYTERMRIDGNGRVGIGTTNPVSILDVVGLNASFPTSSGATQSTGSLVRLRNGNSNLVLDIGGNGGNGNWLQSTNRSDLSTNYPILLNPNGGNVGIGMTGPAYKLDVGAAGGGVISVRLTPGYERVRYYGFDLLGYNDGNLWMMGNNPTNTLLLSNNWDWDYQVGFAYTPGTVGNAAGVLQIGQLTKNNANYTHGITRLYTNGLERITIIANGNIGIGTSSPAAKLHVYNGSSHFESTSNGNAAIVSGLYALQIGPLRDRDSTAGRYYGGIAFNHLLNFGGGTTYNGAPQAWIGTRLQDTTGSERDYLVFATKPGTGVSGTGNDIPLERMCIDRDGLVGIGTTSPTASLHVNSTTAGATLIRADGTNGTLFSVVDDLSDSLMSVNNSAGLPVLEVFADDRIVAGQYGQNDFVIVNNKVGIGTNNPLAELHVTSSTSIPSAVFLGGNVGIGTSSPAARLVVIGETQISSNNAYTTHFNYQDTGIHFISMANGGYTDFRGSSNNITTMRVKGDGSVGIGTTIPSAPLHVVGVISGSSFSGAGTGLTGTAASLTAGTATNATQLGGVSAASYVTLNDTQSLTNKTITGTFTGNLTGNASTSTIVNGTNGQLLFKDIRAIAPNNIAAGYLQFGFTTWTNTLSTSPYADYLHLRSYTDSSGGNDNLVMFRKDVIGMRIWQQTFGSATNYSSYKDVCWTDGTNASGTWAITSSWATNAVTALNVGNGTITIAAGTGVGVGTTNTFTTNQSGATTVTISNNGVTAITTNTGLSTNASATGAVTITNTGVTSITTNTGLSTNASATGAVTITNTGVTSNVAGTGISLSGGTGAVTITNSSPNATHTGDVTGATTLTIANDAVTTAKILNSNVTLAKIANITAGTILGNNNASAAAAPLALTAAQVATMLSGQTMSIAGNAATATILQTARNIGGVSFNGSADINLPGVNTAGNQNTSGNAATATTATNANAISFTEVELNAPATTSGTWTTGNGSEWGEPKFGSTFNQFRYTDGDGPYVEYNVPANHHACFISQLQWDTGGYADCHGVQSDGDLVFLRRINTRQLVENSNHGNTIQHDGSTVTFVGSGLGSFTKIRITNRSGRIHMTGIAFTRQSRDGYEGTGMVHPAQISHQGAGSGLNADLLDGYNSDTANTANTIVLRDASGNFSAGTITATLSGTATTANALNTGNSYTVNALTATSEIGTRGTNVGVNLERGDSIISTLRFDSDNFRLYAGGTGGIGETVRFTETGNVGVGTSNPGRKLDVEGIVRTRGASGSGGFEIGAATTGAAKWRIEWDSASDSLDFNWVG